MSGGNTVYLTVPRGVIAYVTNGGWLDSNTADGMRLTLAEDFSDIYVFNLRGNRRQGGPEGRPIWEAFARSRGGSIATVAVVVLVKGGGRQGKASVRYSQVSDYTTAAEKVEEVRKATSVIGMGGQTILPNEHGDWLNQRSDDFASFIALGDKGAREAAFGLYSLGLATGRDAWVTGSSTRKVTANVHRMAHNYNSLVEEAIKGNNLKPVKDAKQVSWNRNLEQYFVRRRCLNVDDENLRRSAYRPFFKQHTYFDRHFNAMVYRLNDLFPTPLHNNIGFTLTGPSSHYDFCLIAADALPDLHLLDTGQFFARWRYEKVEEGVLSFDDDEGEVGYRKIDNITDYALTLFREAYGEQITKDDIFAYCYGLLHSPDFRETYAADLKKSLPRIPLVTDPVPYIDAGRALFELHLGYESVTPYPLEGLDVSAPSGEAAYEFFLVEKMRFAKVREPETKKLVTNRSSIVYNSRITLSGIPEEAYRYQLGSRAAVEWIMDRYQAKTDKASGIVNDPNDWSREVGDPRYIIDLLARIVTVSLKTMRIVDSLPALEIRGHEE